MKSFQPFSSKIGSEFGIWYALGGSRYDLFIKIKIIHLPQQFKGIYAINIGLPLIFLMNFRSFSGNSEINDDRNYFKIGKTCSSVESISIFVKINRSGRKMSLKLKTIEFLWIFGHYLAIITSENEFFWICTFVRTWKIIINTPFEKIIKLFKLLE